MQSQADDDEGEHRLSRDHRPIRIDTPRLVLRARKDSDVVALRAFAADPMLAGVANPAVTGDTANGDVALTILCAHSGAFIGQAGFQQLAEVPAPVEMKLWLDPGEWGKGYGTEAAHAVIDFAFADGRVGVLWCGIRVSNVRARRVMEKSGFQFRGAGMLRNAPDPGAIPVERYFLDRRNWASLKAWGAPPSKAGQTHAA